MKYTLRISRQAAQDIAEALNYTHEHFGEKQVVEYRELIRDALASLTNDPTKQPGRHRPEIHASAWTFHLRGRGRRARHLFLYRIVDNRFVDIARFLHDTKDLNAQTPSEFD